MVWRKESFKKKKERSLSINLKQQAKQFTSVFNINGFSK